MTFENDVVVVAGSGCDKVGYTTSIVEPRRQRAPGLGLEYDTEKTCASSRISSVRGGHTLACHQYTIFAVAYTLSETMLPLPRAASGLSSLTQPLHDPQIQTPNNVRASPSSQQCSS